MAIHKVVIVSCDRCGITALSHSMTLMDLINMIHKAPESVVDARHRAAGKGWWHTRLGKDLCGNCAPADRPKAKLLSKIPHPHLHWND